MVRENESFWGPLGIICQERCRSARLGCEKMLMEIKGERKQTQAEPSDRNAGLTTVKGEEEIGLGRG